MGDVLFERSGVCGYLRYSSELLLRNKTCSEKEERKLKKLAITETYS